MMRKAVIETFINEYNTEHPEVSTRDKRVALLGTWVAKFMDGSLVSYTGFKSWLEAKDETATQNLDINKVFPAAFFRATDNPVSMFFSTFKTGTYNLFQRLSEDLGTPNIIRGRSNTAPTSNSSSNSTSSNPVQAPVSLEAPPVFLQLISVQTRSNDNQPEYIQEILNLAQKSRDQLNRDEEKKVKEVPIVKSPNL